MVDAAQVAKDAVCKLNAEQLSAFRLWFLDYDAKHWDRQFAADVAVGRLDALAEEAITEREEWHLFSAQNFALGYGGDEPEYSEADLKPPIQPDAAD